jgi:hypothetical protein
MVEVISFPECAFFDLDCMTLLGDIHILCIIPLEITLIRKKFGEPYIVT